MLYNLSLASAPCLSMTVCDAPRPGYGFLDDLREFISFRLDSVNPYQESREYRLQQEQASLLYESLREKLPGEGREMLLAYSEALSDAHCLEVSILAERAFLDGVRLIVAALGWGKED